MPSSSLNTVVKKNVSDFDVIPFHNELLFCGYVSNVIVGEINQGQKMSVMLLSLQMWEYQHTVLQSISQSFRRFRIFTTHCLSLLFHFSVRYGSVVIDTSLRLPRCSSRSRLFSVSSFYLLHTYQLYWCIKPSSPMLAPLFGSYRIAMVLS